MAVISMLQPGARAEDVIERLERDGCVVVQGVLDAGALASIERELEPHLTKESERRLTETFEAAGAPDFLPGNTRRTTGLIAKSPTARVLATHPLMLKVCDATLGPNCSSYQVHATAALVVGPGATVQMLHREDDAFLKFPTPHPNLIAASMWAVTDFTVANGATRLVPGSHLWPRNRRAAESEVAVAEMPAGSVLFWMGATLHGAGANRTDGWRFGVFLSYSLGWLRQEENQYLSVPPEVARGLPEQLQGLVGYRMHDPALGYSTMGDPRALLRG